MARYYSLNEVIACIQDPMSIPGPVDDFDEWSEDEFDGYVENREDQENEDGRKEGSDVSKEVEEHRDYEDEGSKEMTNGQGEKDSEENEEDRNEETEVNVESANEEEEELHLPPYSLTSGCNVNIVDGTPLQFFRMLVDDDILSHVVEQTRIYAGDYIEAHQEQLGARSRVHGWCREPFTLEELKKFLALIIVMGLVNLPTLEDHWVTTWPYCSQAFSRVSICTENKWHKT